MFDIIFKIAILKFTFRKTIFLYRGKYTPFIKTAIVISYVALDHSFQVAKGLFLFFFSNKGEFNLNFENKGFELSINSTLKMLQFLRFQRKQQNYFGIWVVQKKNLNDGLLLKNFLLFDRYQ